MGEVRMTAACMEGGQMGCQHEDKPDNVTENERERNARAVVWLGARLVSAHTLKTLLLLTAAALPSRAAGSDSQPDRVFI